VVLIYRLFLSHSSPTPETKDRLHELAQRIETHLKPGEQIKVLFDQEQITGGDDWRRRIAFMLHLCHGAVVLLDDASLQSKWVLAEATFLSFRRAWNPSFAFIPVSFLGEKDLEEARKELAENRKLLTESPWTVVDLPAIQYVTAAAVDDVAHRIVTSLRDQGQLAACSTPADELASQLAARLKSGASAHLRELASRVESAMPYLTLDDSHLAAMTVVQEMLTSQRLLVTRGLLDPFGISIDDEQYRWILLGLAPLALEGEAAAMLRRKRDDGSCGHASLGCDNPEFFVPLHLKRAYLTAKTPTHFALSNTLGTFEEISSGLRDAIRATSLDLLRHKSTEYLDRMLGNVDTQIHAWVPGPIDAEVMAQLDQAYPRVSFIVHHQADAEPTVLPPGVVQISPPLGADKETDIFDDHVLAFMELQQTQGWTR
jgi:hypothetical protein